MGYFGGGGGTDTSGDNTWTGQQTFKDNKFTIEDDGDATKDLTFQVSGVTAGNTVTPTFSGTTGKGTLEVASLLVKSTGAGTPQYLTVPALTALTGADNVIIGSGAGASLTTGNQNVVIGSNAGDGATTTMTSSVLVGHNAGTGTNIGANNTAVGTNALSATTSNAAFQNTAVGSGALASATTGSGNVAVGYNAGSTITSGADNTIVGNQAGIGAGLTQSIALGVGAVATASNQMVVGGNTLPVTDIYWSEGATNASPLDVTHNATGGSGTDIGGAKLTLAGGKSTGAGVGGSVAFATTTAAGTGTGLNSLTERMSITGPGSLNLERTITAGGTTGNQTINKMAGTVNFAAAATSLTVTNNLVTTSSIVFAVVRTNDATATIKNVVPGSGSFVITLGAGATAETSVGFWVTN